MDLWSLDNADPLTLQRTLSAIFQSSADAIIAESLDGRIYGWNPAAEAIFGYSSEEIRGTSIFDLMPEQSREQKREIVRRVQSGATVKEEVLRLNRAGQSIRLEITVSPIKSESGTVIAILVVAKDLSRLYNERKLKDRLGLLLDRSFDEIFIFAADTFLFQEVSPGARRNLGYSMDELKSLTPLDIKPEFTEDQFQDLVQPLLTGEMEIRVFTTVHRRRDGSLYPVEVRLQLLPESPPCFIAIILDRTELQKYQNQILSAQKKANEASAAKSRFLANMSHEIRTPLNGVIGMATLLRDQKLDSEGRGYLDIVIQSGKHVLGLLNSILEFSRMEAGYLTLQRMPLDFIQVIRNTVDVMSFKASESQVSIQLETHGLPGLILGDSGRITQLLMNLLDNAIKFSTGPVVRLLTRTEPDGQIYCEICNEATHLSEQDLDHVFSAFYQADLGAEYRGSGLGLAICKELVSRMHGTIGVKNDTLNANPAVCFWFRFPFEKAIALEGPSGETLELLDGLRMLIVEDDPASQLVTGRMLESYGCETEVVSNGREALEIIERHRFDGIFMDCRMPVMDGIECARLIRVHPDERNRTVPIVALSAGLMDEERRKCLEAGMEDFLSKPLLEEDLRQVLGRWFSKKSGPQGKNGIVEYE